MKENARRAKELYEQGHTPKEINTLMGLPRLTSVYDLLKRAGVKVELPGGRELPCPLTTGELDIKLRELRSFGLSIPEVAKKMGYSEVTVQRRLAYLGLSARCYKAQAMRPTIRPVEVKQTVVASQKDDGFYRRLRYNSLINKRS